MGRALVTGVVSARPDGATAVAIALAARLSATYRTLLVDLNLERPEIGPLLDLSGSSTVHHLAHNAKLGPIHTSELTEALVWRDGLACLAGVTRGVDATVVTDLFVSGLLEAASAGFDQVVLDLGRLRPDLLAAPALDHLLCAVSPSPLGLWAFDRAWRAIDVEAVGWRSSVMPVLTRVSGSTLDGVDHYLELETGLRVVARLPRCDSLFERLEYRHGLRDLLAPADEEARFSKAFGADVLAFRRAVDELAAGVAAIEGAAASGS
jgi:hypothetical protein